jgi:hypothetical protein
MCRNMYIHGYCRFEGKGCAFRHDRVSLILLLRCFLTSLQPNPESLTAAPEKYVLFLISIDFVRPAPTLRVDTPPFQPRAPSPTKNLSQAANAAVFIPRSQGTTLAVFLHVFTFLGLSSPPLSNSSLPTPEMSTATPALTPLATSLYTHVLVVPDLSTPMSQPSLSQSSENNPYADLDMYGSNSNFIDQVTNGYNQMNLGQVFPPPTHLLKIRIRITRLILA